MDSFDAFEFVEPIVRALHEQGHTKPTPIQVKAIPPILAGNDVTGIAQTGTGKTAAFVLPILQRLAQKNHRLPAAPRALIVAPTRELAAQIADTAHKYAKYLHVKTTVIYGGVPQDPQVTALNEGIDVLVATPGRLLDLLRQKLLHLQHIEVLVLDEADRMLELGFQEEMKQLMQELPSHRQSLLFSATMPPEVAALAQSYLRTPIEVMVNPQATTVDKIKQSVLYVDKDKKFALLLELLTTQSYRRVLVFTQMKHVADKLHLRLKAAGIESDVLHKDKTQSERTQALADFKSGKTRLLVATDIAARGLDIDEVSHVINYELPVQTETYVHRIGRTGRAGAEGTALTFCTPQDKKQLQAIETLIGKKLIVRVHNHRSEQPQNAAKVAKPKPITRKAKPHKARQTKGWKQK
jgi:ATP-dependent RNA helicase RhlE